MKSQLGQSTAEQIERLIEEAIAEGRHSREYSTLCMGPCGQWVGGIYHTTLDGQRLCAKCADEIGAGPESFRLREIERQRRIAMLNAQRMACPEQGRRECRT